MPDAPKTSRVMAFDQQTIAHLKQQVAAEGASRAAKAASTPPQSPPAPKRDGR